MNTRSFALILVRFLGLLFFSLGAQGALGLLLAPAIRGWSILPTALRDNFDYFYAADLWGTPFYLLAGIVLFVASKPLARAMSREEEP